MVVDNIVKTGDLNGLIQEKLSSEYIFDKIKESSVLQRICQQSPLTSNGTGVPTFSDNIAVTHPDEGEIKDASSASGNLKNLVAKTFAELVPVSNKIFRSDNDGWVSVLEQKVIEAIAHDFDKQALYSGLWGDDNNISTTTKAVTLGTGTPAYYADLVASKRLIRLSKKYSPNGFVFDETVQSDFEESVDAQNRPIFNSPNYDGAGAVTKVGTLTGVPSNFVTGLQPAELLDSPVGFVGDWSQATWGQVGNIDYRISEEASATINGQLQSGFERNFVVIRAEVEYGWLVNDLNAFAKFLPATD
jgi:HK97 family phage major capsid protein